MFSVLFSVLRFRTKSCSIRTFFFLAQLRRYDTVCDTLHREWDQPLRNSEAEIEAPVHPTLRKLYVAENGGNRFLLLCLHLPQLF